VDEAFKFSRSEIYSTTALAVGIYDWLYYNIEDKGEQRRKRSDIF